MPFVQLTTTAPVSRELAARLAEEVAQALGLPGGAVIVQRTGAPGPSPDDAGAVAVIRGRLRPPGLMRAAVTGAASLLTRELALDPDLVLVCWPDPGVVATGDGS
ncbi:hypothetical protein [Nonomuraea sp. SBT364]|uniref:hypothetical protein n=1 Tax=Nonomuraea sp. SBT364 TaxID=1580530 RepID=UPI00066E1006|nr:hypothetical protein [Nonomuraea sp. SBT364]